MQRKVERYRYGVWSGRPEGIRRDMTRCPVAVGNGTTWGKAEETQCARTIDHTPGRIYCSAHTKMIEQGKDVTCGALMLVTQERETVTDKWRTVKVEPLPICVIPSRSAICRRDKRLERKPDGR